MSLKVPDGTEYEREIPHLTRVVTVARQPELNLADDPVTREFIRAAQREPEVE